MDHLPFDSPAIAEGLLRLAKPASGPTASCLSPPLFATCHAVGGRCVIRHGETLQVTHEILVPEGPDRASGTRRDHDGAVTKITSCCFSEDGMRFVACTSPQHAVYVWRISEKVEVPPHAPPPATTTNTGPWGSEETHDRGGFGSAVATGDFEQFFIPAQLEFVFTGHLDSIYGSSFLGPGDRYLLTCSADCEVITWNVESGARTDMTTFVRTDSTIRSVIGPPSGVLPATTGLRVLTASADGSVSVWDVQSQTCLGSLPRSPHGHRQSIFRMRLSNSGALLATSSSDGTCKIWNIESFWQDRASAISSMSQFSDAEKRGIAVGTAAGAKSVGVHAREELVAVLQENLDIEREKEQATRDVVLRVQTLGRSRPGAATATKAEQVARQVATLQPEGAYGQIPRNRGYHGYLLQTLQHTAACLDGEFTTARNGQQIVTTAQDCNVYVWDLLSGALSFKLHLDLPVRSLVAVPMEVRLDHGASSYDSLMRLHCIGPDTIVSLRLRENEDIHDIDAMQRAEHMLSSSNSSSSSSSSSSTLTVNTARNVPSLDLRSRSNSKASPPLITSTWKDLAPSPRPHMSVSAVREVRSPVMMTHPSSRSALGQNPDVVSFVSSSGSPQPALRTISLSHRPPDHPRDFSTSSSRTMSPRAARLSERSTSARPSQLHGREGASARNSRGRAQPLLDQVVASSRGRVSAGTLRSNLQRYGLPAHRVMQLASTSDFEYCDVLEALSSLDSDDPRDVRRCEDLVSTKALYQAVILGQSIDPFMLARGYHRRQTKSGSNNSNIAPGGDVTWRPAESPASVAKGIGRRLSFDSLFGATRPGEHIGTTMAQTTGRTGRLPTPNLFTPTSLPKGRAGAGRGSATKPKLAKTAPLVSPIKKKVSTGRDDGGETSLELTGVCLTSSFREET